MQNHEKNLEKAEITEFDFFASILNTVDYLTLKHIFHRRHFDAQVINVQFLFGFVKSLEQFRKFT